jgi:hypothetical protein
MNLFMRAQYTGLRQDTTLVSIGFVTETGKSFYAELTDYNRDHVAGDTWLLTNVIDNLVMNDSDGEVWVKDQGDTLWYKGHKRFVRTKLGEWINRVAKDVDTGGVTVWSDCLNYDWTLFRELWAPEYAIPRQISYIPMDICTLMTTKGVDPDVTREDFVDHCVPGNKRNALHDARVVKACYDKLMIS